MSRTSVQMLPIVTTIVKQPKDWIGARQRAQTVATVLGFSPRDQTGIATAVSEIARNAYEYAAGGRVEFVAETTAPQSLLIRIADQGPGITALDDILAGRYQSRHGLGIGITGSRTLMDEFRVDTRLGQGTTVHLRKFLPRNAPPITAEVVARVADALSRRPADPLEEAQHHNQELLRTLDELGRVNRELQAANEAKDLFLATVSHELRTPMTAILGWIQLLNLEAIEEEVRTEGMQAIESAARVQTRLVEDVLDAARMQSGKLLLDETDLDLREVIDSLWGAMQPAVKAKQVELFRTGHPDPLPVRGDATRLHQIIWNLVGNAIKFTPAHGSITVCAVPQGRNIEISVTDTGEGIEEDLLPYVFERFRQGPNARQHGGLGLGLAIVQHLVALHGGQISVTSPGRGKGACFTVSLPRR